MAVDHPISADRKSGLIGAGRWLVYHLLSLETVLVLFLHGRHLRVFLPNIPFPETLLFGGVSVVVAGWLILRDGIYRRGIPIVIAGLVFSAWMLAAYGWTQETALARENLNFILGVNLWALFVAACVVANSRERVLRLLLLLVAVASVLSFSGLYIEQMHGSFRFYRGSAGDWDPRTYLSWGNIVATGAAIAMALVVQTRLGSRKQLVAAIIFCAGFLFVMISGARGAALGITAAALFALFVDRPRINHGRIEVPKTQFVVVTVSLLLVAYVAYLLTTGQTTSTLGRFLQLFDQADDPLLRRGANRFDYFAGAYRAWLAAPLFGQGLYGFSHFFCGPGAPPGCYPHNAILHILADFGLIGLLLFGVFAVAAMRHLHLERLRRDPLMLTLTMAFVTVVVNVMVASDTATNYRLFFFLGLLALRPPPASDDEEDEEEGEDEDRAVAA